jgi:hypothetical protein
LNRSGGFGGLRATVSLDGSKLPPEKSAELRGLIDAADFFKLPQTIPTRRPQPDRFHYELTIEDGQQVHTVSVSEEVLSPGLKSLIVWLQKHAKA